MPQPNEIKGEYKGHVIDADLNKVTVLHGDKPIYHHALPNNQKVCAYTNFQRGKAWIDGRH